MSHKTAVHRWHCAEFDPALLRDVIGEPYRLDSGEHSQRTLQVYDSFERSFISSGRALVRCANRFRLVRATDLVGEPLESRRVIRHQRPVFAWDFEPGDFQAHVRKRLKLRAAVPLATVALHHTEFEVRNADEKIVLRIAVQTARVGDDVSSTSLQATPLLGYEADGKAIARSLAQLPGLSRQPVCLAQRVLALVGRSDPPLSPKKVIRLDPRQTVQNTVTHIACVMIRVARQSEQGIIDDIDTEYLHDYRVAIRKLRSVLSLVKGAYPKDETRRIRDCFGAYARATNRMRDLDVYLLKEADYRSQLPEALRPGLDRMFADFRAERGRVINKVRRTLRSAQYSESIGQQQDWFNRENLPEGPRAALPIRPVVVKELTRHYRLIRRMGARIDADTPDAEVHELRIECKKLRYLLELFASLFREKDIRNILRHLRGLQTVLGDFNDYSVQMESMNDYLHSARDLDRLSAAAVGGLVAVLHHRQREARGLVAARFGEFSDGRMRDRFEALFAHGEQDAAA